MEKYDWIIVGGGIHGVCAARALSERGQSVRILDPSGRLLDRWARRATAVDMTWMRSPANHHLAARPASLHHFLHEPENADVAELAGVFRRPTYEAFRRHSQDVIEKHRLNERVDLASAESIRSESDCLRVEGGGRTWSAQRVLLATGSNVLRKPDWARRLQGEGAPIHHVFEDGVGLDHDILGGGISALQRALMIRRTTRQTVRLWLRHPLRVHEFDFDRQWTKHKFMGRWTTQSEAERCVFLARNPRQGSVPAKLAERVNRAVRLGQIEIEYGEPVAEWDPAQERLLLRGKERTVESSGLTLATGFEPE
ncbi:MAG: FAD-dependent oxidoreductase, partial [Planctomycetota bacterium]